jgi:hypothetical protein
LIWIKKKILINGQAKDFPNDLNSSFGGFFLATPTNTGMQKAFPMINNKEVVLS